MEERWGAGRDKEIKGEKKRDIRYKGRETVREIEIEIVRERGGREK